MIVFSLLPASVCRLISGLVFLAGLSRLVLILYKLSYKQKLKLLIYDLIVFALLFGCTVFLSASGYNRINIPWLAFAFASALVIVFSSLRILRFRKAMKNTVSPASIRQAFDNLETGIMFTDEDGRAILTNKKTALLCLEISGTFPQTEADVFASFEKADLIDEQKLIYSTPSGKILQLNKCSLNDSAPEGVSQITIQDVTALHKANVLLKEENEQLKKTNEKIVSMLERLSDRIREQETLALKTQIHNDIGVSLIALGNLIRHGETSNAGEQIDLLQNAVSYFSFNRVHAASGGIEQVKNHAKSLGVKLVINGDYEESQDLISAATEVALTNCVNHAGASELYLNITETESGKIIKITNNGSKPDKEIVEGGGLTSLRKEAESRGAEMRIESKKEFALIIELGREK